MGLQARKDSNSIAFAVAKATADTRKGASAAWLGAAGTATLVAGTVTVSNANIFANSVVLVSIQTQGGTLGATYKCVPAAGSAVITAISTTGATVATDTSILSYLVYTPCFHADQTTQYMTGDYSNPTAVNLLVTAASAVDLPTSITSANQIRQVLNTHMADVVAQLVADATNPVAAAVAVDLPSLQTLLNACKVSFNAHLTQAGVHITNDTVNSVATANATDLPTSQTLANALKAAINLHLASAPVGESVTLLPS